MKIIITKNIGNKDRIARIIIAVLFVALNLAHLTAFPENILLWTMAIVFAATAIFAHCPLYTLFGINTAHRKNMYHK